MNANPPAPFDLKASFNWLKWKFGARGHARSALRHVRRCLNEIAAYEYSFLMTKANLLGYLGKWDELTHLLVYLDTRYPNDPEVFYHYAEFHSAHGRWQEALQFLRRAERRIKENGFAFPEGLYSEKLDCLVALGKIGEAKREAKRVLKRHRNFSIIRSALRALENGTYRKPEAWA